MQHSKKLHTFAPAIQQGAIAQLVEQRTENPWVPGSIPGGTTCGSKRDVAQLVAHYVRDVGGGRSSRLIPTNRQKKKFSADFCFYPRCEAYFTNFPLIYRFFMVISFTFSMRFPFLATLFQRQSSTEMLDTYLSSSKPMATMPY